MKYKLKLKLKKEWIIIIIAVLVLGTCIGVSYALSNSHKNNDNQKLDKPVNKEEEKEPYVNHLPEAREEHNNPDIVGEVEVPAIGMKELIVKGTDNKYYLNRDIDKNYTVKGATFMDYHVKDVDNTREINIFGHNSDPNKVPYFPELPFEDLLKYQDEEFFNNKDNLEVIYRTDNGEYKYEIFMVSEIAKEDNEHMYINYQGEEYLNHIKKLRSKALHDTGVEITEEDKIFEMQTCLFNPARLLLVMAKRVA